MAFAGLTLAYGTASATALTVTLVKQFGDWTLYADEASPKALCFVTTQPKEVAPKGAKRDAIHLYVSAWPKDGIKAEPSVKLGYKARRMSEAVATVGTTEFKLFTHEERAFVAGATEELKLLDAMKKGATLTLQATSERGTTTTDTYSLSGLTLALREMASCQ